VRLVGDTVAKGGRATKDFIANRKTVSTAIRAK